MMGQSREGGVKVVGKTKEGNSNRGRFQHMIGEEGQVKQMEKKKRRKYLSSPLCGRICA